MLTGAGGLVCVLAWGYRMREDAFMKECQHQSDIFCGGVGPGSMALQQGLP